MKIITILTCLTIVFGYKTNTKLEENDSTLKKSENMLENALKSAINKPIVVSSKSSSSYVATNSTNSPLKVNNDGKNIIINNNNKIKLPSPKTKKEKENKQNINITINLPKDLNQSNQQSKSPSNENKEKSKEKSINKTTTDSSKTQLITKERSSIREDCSNEHIIKCKIHCKKQNKDFICSNNSKTTEIVENTNYIVKSNLCECI